VAVSGCGGNIGSHLTPHLARLPGISRVILVDPDVYEARNLSGQDIRPEDVGRPKVQVQAERLRAIRPELEVVSFQRPLEDVPLGFFEGAIAVSCLDSRIARVHLNERVWRVGAPLIDTAVDGSSLLYRVTVYQPGEAAPCYECAFEDEDYNLLDTVYPCDADTHRKET
jgi:adenylyltransferase/sulfurtransferase